MSPNEQRATCQTRRLRHYLMIGIAQIALSNGASSLAVAEDLPRQVTEIKKFHIPAQSLSSALATFAQQSGRQTSYDPAIAKNVSTNGVSGVMTPEAALSSLLNGTPVQFHRLNAHTLILERKSAANITLGPVRVGGTMAKESATGPGVGYLARYTDAGTKTDTPITEIPNSIYVITKDQIVDQQAQTIAEVLRYMPGVYSERLGTANAGSGSSPNAGGGGFMQRGFSSTQYVDGIISNMQSAGETAFVERVEAINGPASVMYGQTGPGGIIAMRLKQPTDAPLRNATIGFGNWGRYEATFDVSDKVTKSGNVRYRIAGIGVTQGTQTDYVNYHRVGVLPSIKWDIDNKTSLTLLGEYMYTPGVGSGAYYPRLGTLIPGKYGYIPRSRFLGDPDDNVQSAKDARFEYQLSHKFNDHIEFQQNLSYEDGKSWFNNTYGGTLDKNDGQTFSRSAWKSNLQFRTLEIDSRVIGHVSTGPVHHTLVAGVDYRHVEQSRDLTYDLTPVQSINIWNPVYNIVHPNYGANSPDNLSFYRYPVSWNQTGFYFQDQIKFHNLSILVGGRQDWYGYDYKRYSGNQTPSSVKPIAMAEHTKESGSAFTWRAGLVYNFNFGLSPYFSYSTSFNPQYGSTVANGSVAKPLTGDQFEAGLKYLIPHSNVLLTAAAYHIKEHHYLIDDPDNLDFSTDAGTVVSKGVELSAHANVTHDLRLTASYTYNDTRVAKSDTTVTRHDIYGNNLGSVSEEGKYVSGLPRNMVNMFADYTLPRSIFHGLGVNFGVRYIGFTYADAANSFKVPPYTLFDVGAHYDFEEITPRLRGLKMSLAMSNLTDKRYFGSCSANQCYYGQARRVYGNISYSW